MMREIKNLLDLKTDIILVLQQVNLLLVIHDKQRLRHLLLSVILNVLTICLKRNKPTASQLKDLFHRNLVRHRIMELNLLDFLGIS